MRDEPKHRIIAISGDGKRWAVIDQYGLTKSRHINRGGAERALTKLETAAFAGMLASLETEAAEPAKEET